jgi:DNA ligase (NAD+)
MSQVKKTIDMLRDIIRRHDKLYNAGNPIVTDSVYDTMYKALVKLEEEHPQYADPDSPTQKIHYTKVDHLETVKHSTPILSQNPITDEASLRKWWAQKGSNNSPILAQDKLDGLTQILIYEKGLLVDAVTRGNGFQGDRVLHTVQTIANIPKRIKFQGRLEIRGEALFTFKEFERINTDGRYSNPRNLASGTIRMLDAAEAAKRKMEFHAFDLIHAEGFNPTSDLERLEFLKEQGFTIVKTEVFAADQINQLVHFCQTYSKEVRPTLPYPIDGLVIKFDDLNLRAELGNTSKFPRGSTAFKFDSLDAITTLRDIIWQVGKTGQLTPVAIFEPVEIDGVTISRATLHNYQYIMDKDIRIGDKILLARANDVIPKVVKSFPELRKEELEPIILIQNCPECGQPVVYEDPLIFCKNPECVSQQVRSIIHFCSRDAMDIESLGESSITLLFEKGFLKDITDLFRLHERKEELKQLPGYGEKKVSKMLAAIEDCKNQPLHRLLYALNIPHLGRTNSPLITEQFPTIDAVINAPKEALCEIEGIGDIMATAIVEFFRNEKNLAVIENLKDMEVNMIEPKTETNSTLPLQGLTIVISGTLSQKRADFETMIKRNGGKVSGSVSSKTSYLLLGPDKTGTAKHKKALSLGIPIINEREFLDLLKVGA